MSRGMYLLCMTVASTTVNPERRQIFRPTHVICRDRHRSTHLTVPPGHRGHQDHHDIFPFPGMIVVSEYY
jgi:hypothetical protein